MHTEGEAIRTVPARLLCRLLTDPTLHRDVAGLHRLRLVLEVGCYAAKHQWSSAVRRLAHQG